MYPRRFRLRTALLTIPIVLGLTLSFTGTASAAPSGDPAPDLAAPPAGVITLVTGDQVTLQATGSGLVAATIEPAPRANQVPVTFETYTHGDDTYVIPSDAAPLVPDVLDRELFNLRQLAELADHGVTGGTPVIVENGPGTVATLAEVPGMTATRDITSIDAVAGVAGPGWWDTLAAPAAAGALRQAGKVWLDGLSEIALAESVPLVGAPEAWAAGFDGTGLEIAVLDTGIDADHPDVAGKVVAAENFTDEPDATDQNGHGTHVSGIAAGTGAASDGERTGVAPGADLLMGKVCNASGNCQTSWIMDGMEWAAERADVVNMSLGTNSGSDGNDPLSQTLNTLAATHDTLFVTSAGNIGFLGDGSVGAPAAADAALAVGSVDKQEELAGTSSRGPRLGDFAIKPNMTAPGVAIVAPRAEGTSLGTPVDDNYTTVSGTSMASPHVAGAAAIALQQNPDLTAEELRALLTNTAVPHPDLEVYQQGGGRLDVPSVLEAPVRTDRATVDLGYFPFPQGDADPAPMDVSYTNRTDEPVTLDLALAVSSRGGETTPAEMLSVSPSTLTVPAGGTAATTVTLDVGSGPAGLYGGYLVAEAGGEPAARTPVGFFKEPERYNITVEGIARDGRPAGGISSFHVLDVVDTSRFLETSIRFSDGVATVRVPPGTYHIMGNIYTYDGNQQFTQERTLVGLPEVEVTGDTTVTLDATDAVPIDIETPQHPEALPLGQSKIAFYREASEVGSLSASWAGSWQPTFAVPTDPVTLGAFEFNHRTQLGDSPLQLDLVEPTAQMLHPRPMSGTPPLDDDVRLPVVWVGAGEDPDYEGLDVTGALVLSQRGLGPSHAEREATARAHGAAALAVMNNFSGNYAGSVGGAAEIPTMTLPMEEGQLLRELAADGDVTVRMRGVSNTAYRYDLVFAEPDRIPDALDYVAAPDILATQQQHFHSDVPGWERNTVRHFWRPTDIISFGVTERLTVPHDRLDLLVANDTRYKYQLYGEPPFTGIQQEPITMYTAGEEREASWFRTPMVPGAIDGGEHQASQPTVRDGDVLFVRMQEWSDADGHYGIRHTAVDTSAFRLYENGELIGEAARGFGNFPVSPDPAVHRLELDVDRTADWWQTAISTRTAWTLRSEGTSTGPVPLLMASYEADVDLSNTASSSGVGRVGLSVGHQPEADGPAIHPAAARAWISYDDGETWRRQPVVPGGDGDFTIMVIPPRPGSGAEYASLRITAADAAGNGIEQEVIRAWRLAR